MKQLSHNRKFMLANIFVFCIIIYLYAIEYVKIQDGYAPGIKLLIILLGMITGGSSIYGMIVKCWGKFTGFKWINIINLIGKKSIYIYIYCII